VISFITVGEMYFGARKAKWNKAKIERLEKRIRSVVVAPYDLAVCEAYARLKSALPKGRTIEDNDIWIAACAVRHSIPLLTHNRKHFDDFKELIVISEVKAATEIASQMILNAPSEPEQPS
jgi:tRNA(fMet)-specific endonuclease VapC